MSLLEEFLSAEEEATIMLINRYAWGMLVLGLMCGHAWALPFNNVVTLGDSLQDDPGGGRSPVAAEHVAQRLGTSVTKFAVSGSTSEDMIANGQHTQAAAQFGSGDLAMLWIGGNDFFTNPFEIAFGENDFLVTLEANADIAISTLREAELEVVLYNLPDMSQVPGVINSVNAATVLTPFLRSSAFDNITDATIAWNTRIDALAETYDATVVDVFGLFNEFKDDPSAFSLLGNTPILNTDSGCQFCVFFDDLLLPDVHPSSFAQGFIANEAIAAINAKYDPNGTMPLEPLSIFEIATLAGLVPGDLDGDQFVSGQDLAWWQSNYGTDAADGDGDGDSDGADYLLWQTQHAIPATMASATVPEPQTLALLAVSIPLGLIRRRGCRGSD